MTVTRICRKCGNSFEIPVDSEDKLAPTSEPFYPWNYCPTCRALIY